MRIRSTKPEFWRSRRIADVSWDARLVLKGLESYVDDNGVGKDDLALIVSDLFSRDLVREPSRTLARVSEAISELHQAGLVWRYEGDGSDLLYLSFWETIQRVDKPQAGRFPRPDGTYGYKDSEIRECVASPREDSRALAPGTGEQGNRGTGEQSLSSDADTSDQAKRNDVERLCDHLADRVEANGVKRPAVTKRWRDSARLAMDADGFTEDQLHWLIDRVSDDEFWRSNVMAMPKLREKAPQLRLKFAPPKAEPSLPNVRDLREPPPNMTDDEIRDWYDAERRRA